MSIGWNFPSNNYGTFNTRGLISALIDLEHDGFSLGICKKQDESYGVDEKVGLYRTQTEGQVFEGGCNIFTIYGPVILFGTLASWVLAAFSDERRENIRRKLTSYLKKIPEKDIARIWIERVGKFQLQRRGTVPYLNSFAIVSVMPVRTVTIENNVWAVVLSVRKLFYVMYSQSLAVPGFVR